MLCEFYDLQTDRTVSSLSNIRVNLALMSSEVQTFDTFEIRLCVSKSYSFAYRTMSTSLMYSNSSLSSLVRMRWTTGSRSGSLVWYTKYYSSSLETCFELLSASVSYWSRSFSYSARIRMNLLMSSPTLSIIISSVNLMVSRKRYLTSTAYSRSLHSL